LDALEHLRNHHPPFTYSNHDSADKTIVAMVCKGVPEDLFLIQLATNQEVYLFDCVTLGAKVVCDFLRPLLADERILKLIHDLHHTASALKTLGNVDEMQGMFDTQIAVESRTRNMHSSIHQMLQEFEIPSKFNGNRMILKHTVGTGDNLFVKRPLDSRLLLFAYEDTIVFLAVHKKLCAELDNDLFVSIQLASDARARYAAQMGGERNVCFDHTNSYCLSSYEYLKEVCPDNMVASSLPIVYNDPSPLIELLPIDFATWLRLFWTRVELQLPGLEGNAWQFVVTIRLV
jgi:3'-5' exonuclease